MAGGERAHATRTLRALVRETKSALQEVADILNFDEEIPSAVQDVGALAARPAALVLLGTSASARARLLHRLLGRRLLPEDMPRGCKWVKVQYGSSTQVHLTLGNSEFELVEELECNKRRWDTLPAEDLVRQDHIDLATMLEVELNVPFLKHGLPVIIPPDIEASAPSDDLQTLKQKHSELYAKRDLILRNYNPVYLCAIDKIGKNIFSDNFMPHTIGETRSEEDFWNLFNLYQVGRPGDGEGESEGQEGDKGDGATERRAWKGRGGPAVFNSEVCLDLHQVKNINAHAQILFALFADSRAGGERRAGPGAEATESTEDWYAAEDLPESDQELLRDGVIGHTKESPQPKKSSTDTRRLKEKQVAFMNELLDQWELMSPPTPKHYVKSQSLIVDDADPLPSPTPAPPERPPLGSRRADDPKNRTVSAVIKFWSECMQTYVLQYSTRLSEVHLKLVQQLILASFDMARELQVVPRKIQYVATQERQLYETITEKFSEGEKKQELLQIMQEVLKEMKTDVNNMDWSVDDLPCHQDRRFHVSNSVFYSWSQGRPDRVRLSGLSDASGASAASRASDTSRASCASDATLSDGEEAVSCESYNFDDYDIILKENGSRTESFTAKPEQDEPQDIPSQVGSIRIENESEMSSMWSTLLRSGWGGASSTPSVCTNANNISLKQASLDVQQTVLSKLSRMISLKLVKFMDCLNDTYFGTLQRCLESLESSCRQELGGRPASEAMRQLMSVARQVDLQPCASFSLLRSMVESLRRLFYKLRMASDESADACCVLSPVWRRQVALTTTASLSPQRLARVISAQILERLSVAHERYQSALTSLESALTNRLHNAQDTKLAIRKTYAPSFARLCLESTSLCDLLMYGTPELGREIGRGQYGVVYAVKGSWGGHGPAAVKSVLPADRRHYHELAMEFFYTRSIPAHPRIVRLLGSVVARHSAGPSVLLVAERRARDLHAAVRRGLAFATRLRISCDIVEGIRYLHSFGLVHRDIKMKNVLLDAEDRAALSDLGFCASEALITGSVVGTPVHMAPELLHREYDASVDVYAFGILFWYVCAGNIKLPSAFETFLNKEQLWNKVKKGLRPERLPHFSDECWELMESCWASEPADRAHLGDIQPKLEKIFRDSLRGAYDNEPCAEKNTDCNALSDDDSYLTGIDRGISSLNFGSLHAQE